MKKILIVGFLLFYSHFILTTKIFASSNNMNIEFFENVKDEVFLEDVENINMYDESLYSIDNSLYCSKFKINIKGVVISYCETENYLYILYCNNNIYYLERISLKNEETRLIEFNYKVCDIKINNEWIYIVGCFNNDAVLYRYDSNLTLYSKHTYGGDKYEEFCKIYFIKDQVYVFGLKNGISHNSKLSNVGNSMDIKPFILKLDHKYDIEKDFYVNEHTEYESFKSIVINEGQIYFIIEDRNKIYYQYHLDLNFKINERYEISNYINISDIYLMNSHNMTKEKIYIYTVDNDLYYGVFTNSFIHNFKIDDTINNLEYTYLNEGKLKIFCKVNEDIIKYTISMYYIDYKKEKVVHYKDNAYFSTNHFFASSYFEKLTFTYDYEKNSNIFFNKSGVYEAFYSAKKQDGTYVTIATPYIVNSYLNIVDQGIYQKGYQLEFSDNLYVNDKKVYNGEPLNIEGKIKITQEIDNTFYDYIIYVKDGYYKYMDINHVDTDVNLNINDKYLYNIILSYEKKISKVIVNGEEWKFIQNNNTLTLEFFANQFGIEQYNIDYIEFIDGNIIPIDERVIIKTKKSLPIIDIYYQNNVIDYNVLDNDRSITDLFIKYYLSNNSVKIDRTYLNDYEVKINDDTVKVEIVLQYENGTSQLFEQVLFEINATSKNKERKIFNIHFRFNDNKIDQILIKDFNFKKINLSSATILNLSFTHALIEEEKQIVVYISIFLTIILIGISSFILIYNKKS